MIWYMVLWSFVLSCRIHVLLVRMNHACAVWKTYNMLHCMACCGTVCYVMWLHVMNTCMRVMLTRISHACVVWSITVHINVYIYIKHVTWYDMLWYGMLCYMTICKTHMHDLWHVNMMTGYDTLYMLCQPLLRNPYTTRHISAKRNIYQQMCWCYW